MADFANFGFFGRGILFWNVFLGGGLFAVFFKDILGGSFVRSL